MAIPGIDGNYTGAIRCHPDAGVLSDPPSFMFVWDTKWWAMDLAGDYASDIPLLGMPEILGAAGNMVGLALAWLLFSRRDDLHPNARGCFQWMLLYFLMHGAIHMTWGYKFRVPFTAGMNI